MEGPVYPAGRSSRHCVEAAHDQHPTDASSAMQVAPRMAVQSGASMHPQPLQGSGFRVTQRPAIGPPQMFVPE
jgi:hypothetical protein